MTLHYTIRTIPVSLRKGELSNCFAGTVHEFKNCEMLGDWNCGGCNRHNVVDSFLQLSWSTRMSSRTELQLKPHHLADPKGRLS